MKSDPKPSLTASLCALVLALMIAGLVHWSDWTPLTAILVVAGAGLAFSLIGMVLVMAIAPRQNDRAELWTLFMETARADMQPFVILWNLIRGRRR